MRITDKAFRYVPSFSTDISKRFKEIIREQRANALAAAVAAGNLVPALVVPIAGRRIK